jgi:Cu2+-containing amine oxidase
MSEMYNGRLSAEVVFMGVSPYTSLSQDKQRIKEVFSLVKNDVVSKESFEAYFPTIYLINPDKQEAICNKLKSALDSSNLKVI